MYYRELLPGDVWLSLGHRSGYMLISTVCDEGNVKMVWQTLWGALDDERKIFIETAGLGEEFLDAVVIVRNGAELQSQLPQ
jgi:hypothetical protein